MMRISDNRRVQLLWEEVCSQGPGKSQPPTVLQDNAKQLLVEYAEELAFSLVEAATLLAQGRGSKQIEESDISLLLAKKMGVELAGHEVTQPLYHNNLKSSIYPTVSEKSDLSEQRKGMKRKYSG